MTFRLTQEEEDWFTSFFKSDEFSEVLATLWALGSYSDNGFTIRHANRGLIERFSEMVMKTRPIRSQIAYIRSDKDRPYEQWVCSMHPHHPLVSKMKDMGWLPVQAENRPFPSGDLDEDVFCKAYIRLRHTLTTSYSKEKNYLRPQLYIYGSQEVLLRLTSFLCKRIGTKEKKVQHHSQTSITKTIIYSSKVEVPQILEYIEANGTLEKFRSLNFGYQ
ncbi:hypothetical protein GJU41_19490 [Bacillus idriensis]|uniref:Homing endonuclease LAGLIDADG domain-containing protein n=1 Tax=Metabacillus idriensis TaxID=324768 RepID=A0A6I2MCL3_9BACI|nr:hypothetical protein [Metabacillus idriensis]MRX56145.1 hypothetical protein [Metabacillus idriensis]